MDTASFVRLLGLAAIWGASFLFMRIGVPVLGPVWTIAGRVACAALFLLAVGVVLGKRLEARTHWRHYLVLGLLNSALPFMLFGFAAQTLSASLLSVLNATAPISGAVIAAIASRRMLPARMLVGLALGVAGVALLVGFDRSTLQPNAGIAVFAAVGAAFSYGLASVYTRVAPNVDAFANANGSMWAAVVLTAPAVAFFPALEAPSIGVVASVVALGVVCSGIAYLLYFRLIADIGPASALTVTFLIPLFGVLWGRLFLGEVVGWYTFVGSLTVLLGTALVTGFSPRALFAKKPMVADDVAAAP